MMQPQRCLLETNDNDDEHDDNDDDDDEKSRNHYTVAQETIFILLLLPTKFGKHFLERQSVGSMAEEGRGCPVMT